MLLSFACAVILLVSCARTFSASAIWIDTDVSIGSPIREVDDAFALALAFHCHELRIAGISTSYGNASLPFVDGVARDMTFRFGGPAHLTGRDVYAGARSAKDLGRATAASAGLAATLRKERLTYVAIGPLTNLATVLRLHPELARQLNAVVFLGGTSPGERLTFGRNNAFTIHDANVVKDSVAVETVLRSGVPLFLLPISTARRLTVDANDLRGVAASGSTGEYLSRRSQVWLWFWKNVVRAESGPLFDAAPMIALLKPSLVSWETRYATAGRDGTLIASRRRTPAARPVRYGSNLKPAGKAFFLRRLKR